MTACYLRINSEPLNEATKCRSVKEAVEDFEQIARERAQTTQTTVATIHYFNYGIRGNPQCAEYPNWVLTFVNNKVHKQRA